MQVAARTRNQMFTVPQATTLTVRCATTVSGTFSTAFDNGSVVDGITLAIGDLILVKNQATASENGVWIVPRLGSPTVRALASDTAALLSGLYVNVMVGTANIGTQWKQNNTLNSTSSIQNWTNQGAKSFAKPITPVIMVHAASTVSGTFSTAFDNASAVDGVTLVTGEYILVKNQASAAENGVWVVPASGSPTVRVAQADSAGGLTNLGVRVIRGTLNGTTTWFQNNTLSTLSSTQSWSRQAPIQYFTVPDFVTEIDVIAIGGGGGGGGGDRFGANSGGGGGGGGGGGALMHQRFDVTPGEVLWVYAYHGGERGVCPSTTGNDGADGGDFKLYRGSTILLTASGGKAGLGATGATTIAGGAGIDTTSFLTFYRAAGGASGGAAAAGADGEGSLYTPTTPNNNGAGSSGGGGGGGGGNGWSIDGTAGVGGTGGTGGDQSGGSATVGTRGSAYGAGGGGGGGASSTVGGGAADGASGSQGMMIISWVE